MSNTDFERFLEQRRVAAEAYVAGDAEPVDALVPSDGAATFHSPVGDTVSGAAAVAVRYRKDAASNPVERRALRFCKKDSSGDLGFWTGLQLATAQLVGQDRLAEMKIRVTEVFRKVDGEWKMVHRHADMPKPGQ